MKRSFDIFQYGSHPRPSNLFTGNSPSSSCSSCFESNSINSLPETPSDLINSLQLQTAIQKKVTSLIEQHGYQSIYGDNYASLGQ